MVDTLTTAQPSWDDMVGTSKSVSGVQNIMRKHHSQRGGLDLRFRRKWRKCKIARAAHRHWVGGTPQALAQVLDPTNPRSATSLPGKEPCELWSAFLENGLIKIEKE